MKVLVIVAHPDDEVLGMGGTLLRHRNAGDEIYIHILTDGHSSRLQRNNIEKMSDPLLKERIVAAKLVAQKLNAMDILVDNFEDQMLDTYPHLQIVRAIESFAKQIKPEIVYTHFGGDVNKDHRITFSAVITAFRPVDAETPVRILCAEIPPSTEWGIYNFEPNFFVNISGLLKEKTELLSFYKNEIKEFPHPRSLKKIIVYNEKWGSYIFAEAAEAFFLYRNIWK